MASVHIDISLFTKDAAYGMVSGSLELAVVPQVGDVVAFRHSGPSDSFTGELSAPFCGHLRVTDRVIPADRDAEVIIILEDLTAATIKDAQQLVMMFETEHGLLGEVWHQ